jgi:hypothetical protein
LAKSDLRLKVDETIFNYQVPKYDVEEFQKLKKEKEDLE